MAKERRTDAERRARQCERIGRVLRVLQFVLSRGEPWDAEGIARELEVSENTVYRDIQTLQLAGVPVYHDEQAGGYRVRPGFRLTCLDDLGERPHTRGQDNTAFTPEQLADASLNAAQRLLSDTQELVDHLTRLRDSLGSQKALETGHRPHRRRSSS